MIPINNSNSPPSFLDRNVTYKRNTSAETATQSYNKDQYYAIWSEWKKALPPGENELRDVAVKRMQDCLRRGSRYLDLERLNITSLPRALPEQIYELDIENNRLRTFPDSFPPLMLNAHIK